MSRLLEILGGKRQEFRQENVSWAKLIDLESFGVDLKTSRPVVAAESRVFRGVTPAGRSAAVKVFDTAQGKFISVEALIRYQNLTAKVGRTMSPIDRKNLFGIELRWQVTPIDEVGYISGENGEKIGVTVSQFVEGPRLDEIWDGVITDPKYSPLTNGFEVVKKLIFDRSRRLGNPNLFVVPMNIKLRLDGDICTLVVTDLAPLVSKV